ncbi:multiple sugar transport system ATP-binding protein [Catenuloplanes nepalensis]|uniref:Multiple sugar transport system ATP-binding protein n=1 Tax=Catenuloplanes nepalensis TaxID=587533 RepID=A0ABT9N1H7_9ACTN|nr:ABC transporter ATP-binding protein [Catenuloplanes nepalensis]MDP9797546.1 multiple sugar transport system ATP-binding protein [Catenuloplanes nepalensis]
MTAVGLDHLGKVFDDGTVAVEDLSLEIADGELVVFVGPTGCGKSTVLRLVAGLETPTAGHVRFGGRIVDQLRTRDRNVAMVFQHYALYPHLTVAQNIGFPLRSAPGVSELVARAAARLGLSDVLDRRPAQLSGGERQLVAMARALVRQPRVFLLDEPLAHLDAGLRAELRGEVAATARRIGVTTLYVTHDQAEALAVADRVAVLRDGALQQVGTPAEVYDDPASVFVAAFLGAPRANLFEGAVYPVDGRVAVDLGSQVLTLPADDARAAALLRHGRITVGLRPDALRTATPAQADGASLRGQVRHVEHHGHEGIVHLDAGGLPTPPAQTMIGTADPAHLAGLLADPPDPGPRRGVIGRLLPRAATPAHPRYGLHPAYEPSADAVPDDGDLVVRVPTAAGLPRPGENLTIAVDLDRLLLFDSTGTRIRAQPRGTEAPQSRKP